MKLFVYIPSFKFQLLIPLSSGVAKLFFSLFTFRHLSPQEQAQRIIDQFWIKYIQLLIPQSRQSSLSSGLLDVDVIIQPVSKLCLKYNTPIVTKAMGSKVSSVRFFFGQINEKIRSVYRFGF